MCSTSAVMRYEHDRWNQPSSPMYPYLHGMGGGLVHSPTQAEFDALKKEVEELKALLLAAKKFDEATGQPECEAEDKVAMIKKIAEIFGVDLREVL